MTTEQIAEAHHSPPRPERERSSSADVRAKAAEVDRQFRMLIRQRPIAAVLAAVGLGYLTARLVARAHR